MYEKIIWNWIDPHDLGLPEENSSKSKSSWTENVESYILTNVRLKTEYCQYMKYK